MGFFGYQYEAEYVQPAAAAGAVQPVILYRNRTLSELAAEQAHPAFFPKYQRFPYFDQANQPAWPRIVFRYGQDVLESPRAFVPPAYQRFPYWQEPPVVPASPIIGMRYGQTILLDPQAFVPPHYERFPYFEQPANPPVPIRYGRDILIPVEAFVPPQYQRFPYPSVVPPPPANPVIPIRLRPLSELVTDSKLVLPEYFRFPYVPGVVPNLDQLFIDVETGRLYWRLNATTKFIVRLD